MFELKLNNKTVQLKWGTWAMREFCEMKGITVEEYFQLLGQSKIDLDYIVKVVFAGYKAACMSNKEEVIHTEIDICDWIDEIGSIFNTEGQLIDYLKYIVSTTTTSVKSKAATEKKKSK